MKRSTNKAKTIPDKAMPYEVAVLSHAESASDDELEIRFSLTSLGELAVASGDRAGRGRRFRGFGPCGAVA